MRAYFASSRWLQQASSFAKAVLDGAWLGLLDDRALREVDETYYARAKQYADPAFNRRGFWAWERSAIDRHFSGRKRIVVTAAGGGREMIALAERGHDVTGFECNAQLLEAARALDLDVTAMAPSEWPAEAPKADGVIVGWSSYMLMRGRERRIAFLRGARSVLESGAPLLLSFISKPAGSGYLRVVSSVANVVGALPWRRVRTEPGDALQPFFMHHFDDAEIASELEEGGFERAESGQGSGLREDDYGWAVGLAR